MPSDCLLELRKIRSTDFPLSKKKNPGTLSRKAISLDCHDLLLINHIYFIQISACCRSPNYSFLQVVFKSFVYFCAQINLLRGAWILFPPSDAQKNWICWLSVRWYHSHYLIWACCLLNGFCLICNSFHTLVCVQSALLFFSVMQEKSLCITIPPCINKLTFFSQNSWRSQWTNGKGWGGCMRIHICLGYVSLCL